MGREIKSPPWCHKMSEWWNWVFSPGLLLQTLGLILLVQPTAAERSLVVECQHLRLRTQTVVESDRDLGFRLWTWTFSWKRFGALFSYNCSSTSCFGSFAICSLFLFHI